MHIEFKFHWSSGYACAKKIHAIDCQQDHYQDDTRKYQCACSHALTRQVSYATTPLNRCRSEKPNRFPSLADGKRRFRKRPSYLLGQATYLALRTMYCFSAGIESIALA
jgi:hypothetical protein